MNHVNLDKIYRQTPVDRLPWVIEQPPEQLVELIDTAMVQPCKAIDFGCGTGNYATYLAGRGFDVTGVDISPTAIRFANENAKKAGVDCIFVAADVLGSLDEIGGHFGFAYDWELLHHIFPPQRPKYVANVHRKLHPGGRYLSLCFSEKNAQFGGKGKYRDTPLGTRLYFSSENELRNLFEPYFDIKDLRTIQVRGKYAPHHAVYVLMKKKPCTTEENLSRS